MNRPHPLDHPDFGKTINEKVWYLAHPLAPDDKFNFQQNMDHVVHMMRLCFDEGFRVVAPYHTICLALDDDNLEHRRIGLESDCYVVKRLGRIIFTGHKMSSGMAQEQKSWEEAIIEYCDQYGYGEQLADILRRSTKIDLIGMPDYQAKEILRHFSIFKNGR